MGEFFKSIDTILWGRKTYDKGIEMGMKASGFGPRIRNYVFSRHPHESPEPEFEFVTEPVKTFAQRLRAQRGKDIWMMGGGGMIASFLDEGEIDEFSIHVIPILIGEGIPLDSTAPSLRLVEAAVEPRVSRRGRTLELSPRSMTGGAFRIFFARRFH